jgi:hypothetical protein
LRFGERIAEGVTVTVSPNEPADAADATIAGDGTAVESVGSSSIFAPALQGFLELADVVSDHAPDIAGLMVMGAHVVRAALEEEIEALVRDLGQALGLSRSGRHEFEAALRADSPAYTSQALAYQMSDAYSDLVGESSGSEPDDLTKFINDIITAFVDSPRVTMRGGDEQYRNMTAEVDKITATGASPRWEAVGSLELPHILGGCTPIYCARRGHRWISGGTHLRAMELTYTAAMSNDSFVGRVHMAGQQVAHAGVGGGYRDTLTEAFPPPFYGVIGKNDMGLDTGLSGWSYGLHLVEGPGAQILTKLPAALSRQQRHAEAHIGALVQRSAQRVRGVLTAANISLTVLNPLLGIIKAAADAVVGFIVHVLVKAWSEQHLSTWTIWHTALIGTKQVPISVFTLTGRDEASPKLRRLLGKNADGTPKTDDKYLGDFHNPEQELQARFLIGSSAPGPNLFDDRYFGEVAKIGRPLVWQEPLETGSGLRILLPHLDRPMDGTDRASSAAAAKRGDEGMAALAKIMYVSAIRADVGLTAERAVVRRPQGKSGSFQLS